MSTSKFTQSYLSIFSANDFHDGVGRKFARTKRVINSFTGEWLDHARGVADEKKILVNGRNGCARERRDRPPCVIDCDPEVSLGPSSQRSNGRWPADEAEIQFILIHRRLPGITFGKKLENDAISEFFRQRNVRLQCDTFAFGSRKQIAKTRHGGVASISSDKNGRLKNCFSSSRSSSDEMNFFRLRLLSWRREFRRRVRARA